MIYNKLFDWQKQIIEEYEERDQFGLFLDMGLGKTPLSLAFAEAHDSDKILIISINKKALEDETVDYSFLWWAKYMEIPYNLYNKKYNFRGEGSKKWQREITPDTKDILLVNYEGTYKPGQSEIIRGKKHKRCVLSDMMEDFVESCKNNTVTIIVDESHKVKELDSLQTMALKMIQKRLGVNNNKVYTYLLTGTPFTKGFIDLYCQLKILGWEGNKTQFEDLFCIRGSIPGLLGWQQPIVAYKNVEQLYKLVHRFAITIKSDTVVTLPEQVFIYHKLPNTDEMNLFTCEQLKKEILENYINKNHLELPYNLDESIRNGKINNPFYRNIAFPDLNWIAETSGTFWMRARQLSIGFQGNSEEYKWFNKSRLDELKTLLEDHPDNYVLFYNYDPEFYELFDLCYGLGYNVDVCNGSIHSEYFYQKYSKQSPGERLTNTKNIIIANFASGAEGGNWQLYNKCILFSVPLFGQYEQSIKRVHRLGQKDTVIYHIFYSQNWLDLSMMKSLKSSKDYNQDMFEADLKRVQDLLSIGKEVDI